MGLVALETRRSDGPLRVQREGSTAELPHAVDLTADLIYVSLTSSRGFAGVFGLAGMTIGQTAAVRRAWVAHCDLPSERASVLRLFSTVDKFEVELEHDLQRHMQVDLTALWRARRWRQLLSFIDRLPRDSSYMTALLASPEYVAAAGRAPKTETAPPAMTWWSEEVESLACIRDLLSTLIRVQLAAGGAKNLPKVEPVLRPTVVLERASRKDSWEKHKALAARIVRPRVSLVKVAV